MNNSKLIDLHTHTCFSDGDHTPEEVIKMAINNNVGMIAITDHNTTNGLKTIDKSLYKKDIDIINGIELSAYSKEGRMHILGLGIDIYNEELNNVMNIQISYSFQKFLTIIEQIKRDHKIVFPYEELVNSINLKNFNRPEIARLCVKYHYANDIEEAFQKYLNPAYKKTKEYNKRLSYEECFGLIKKSGGISILAHPKSLCLSQKDFLIELKKMISCGLEGIEAYHYCHSIDEMSFYTNVANENGLYISAGSDYHGEITKPNVKIGTGLNNNLNIRKLVLADKLKSSR